MKRDWELIRILLEKVEDLPDTRSKLLAGKVAGHLGITEDTINYHLWLLLDAGLIEGACAGKPGRGTTLLCCGQALTWKGHEFLDTVRSDTAWNRIKRWLNEEGFELSFEAIVAAGRAVIASVEIG